MIRLQKVLADRGVASRRTAEELMREGRVRVGGEVVRDPCTGVLLVNGELRISVVLARARATRHWQSTLGRQA